MSDNTAIASLEGRSVRLIVGNTPIPARVIELSGLALKMGVSEQVASVPRVRVELEGVEGPLASLQLQGMVTGRDEGGVTVTLERLIIAAGREQVDSILRAWFTAVPRVEACYKPMMRGHGYELRKAILSGRMEPASSAAPMRPRRRANDPMNDTLDGLPLAAVRAELDQQEVAISMTKASEARTLVPEVPLERALPSEPQLKAPAPQRATLSPQVSRTGLRLLEGTQHLHLPLDCSADAAGYGRGFLYRLAKGGRLGFVAAKGIRPGFGARIELITDLDAGELSQTIRIATSVVWLAPDPDYPQVSLMALRLAPTNQPSDLYRWDVCCNTALAEGPKTRSGSLVPTRQEIESLKL